MSSSCVVSWQPMLPHNYDKSMQSENDQRPNKPLAKIRLIALVLALTLIAFGILGALVTLLPPTRKPSTSKGPAPPVRQIDRETLKKGNPVPGS